MFGGHEGPSIVWLLCVVFGNQSFESGYDYCGETVSWSLLLRLQKLLLIPDFCLMPIVLVSVTVPDKWFIYVALFSASYAFLICNDVYWTDRIPKFLVPWSRMNYIYDDPNDEWTVTCWQIISQYTTYIYIYVCMYLINTFSAAPVPVSYEFQL